MHSLTKVFVPSANAPSDAELEYKRALWVTALKPRNKKSQKGVENVVNGLYLFGGHNKQRKLMNDLWLIKPNLQENFDRLNADFNYLLDHLGEKRLFVNVIKLEPDGMPPAPRAQHAAVHF